jgi:hemerythrin-like metal-binding protein
MEWNYDLKVGGMLISGGGMSVIEWSADIALAAKKIDNQHKQLVALLNKSKADFMADPDGEESTLDIAELVEYASFQLKEEVHWLSQFKGFSTDHLQREMERLRGRLVRVQNHYFKEGKLDSERILAFMQRWIAHRVTAVDTCGTEFTGI